MNKTELKKLLKPLIKECIKEVMFEDGVLSGVVSEVARGLGGNQIVESQEVQLKAEEQKLVETQQKSLQEQKQKINESRQKLLDAIGNEAYNGVNLFEGTEPLHSNEPKQGQTDLGSPKDAGVDISSIFGNASQIWQAMK